MRLDAKSYLPQIIGHNTCFVACAKLSALAKWAYLAIHNQQQPLKSNYIVAIMPSRVMLLATKDRNRLYEPDKASKRPISVKGVSKLNYTFAKSGATWSGVLREYAAV